MDTDPCLTLDDMESVRWHAGLACDQEKDCRLLARYILGLLPNEDDWEVLVRLQTDEDLVRFAEEVERRVFDHKLKRHAAGHGVSGPCF